MGNRARSTRRRIQRPGRRDPPVQRFRGTRRGIQRRGRRDPPVQRSVSRRGESRAQGLRDERTSYLLERRSGDICVAYRESLGFSCFQPTPLGVRAMQHVDAYNGLDGSRGRPRCGRASVAAAQIAS